MLYFLTLVSALVTIVLTAILLRSEASRKILDVPNERSLHNTEIPRVGGIALIIGILSGCSFLLGVIHWWLLTPFVILFVVSILDDMLNLPVRWRLLVQMGVVVLFMKMSGLIEHGLITGLVLIFLMVWMTNLYNFMDGSDGLSGGMTVIGFFTYAVAALLGHNEQMGMVNFSVAASAAGFLCFNFHPAKVFMGDAGSIPLGFLSAAMGVLGWQKQLWPMWFPLLVFSPFILDATVTLFKRAFRGEKVWKAHREHYYQRMLMLGVGHRNTALIEYALMISIGIGALWALRHPAAIVYVLLIWTVVCSLAMIWVDVMWKRKGNV
jgi:UDP-N-acetylmuramyl pentapeptide phosphotransferase/UDP-N-acetylglucosamine-1-phosphate transferase